MFKSINGTVMLQKWIKTDTQTDTNALSQKASNLQSLATTGGGGKGLALTCAGSSPALGTILPF